MTKIEPEQMTDPALAASEAARVMGLSANTLAKWRVYGGGPRYVKAGRRVIYRMSDIREWQDSLLRRSTSDVGGGQSCAA